MWYDCQTSKFDVITRIGSYMSSMVEFNALIKGSTKRANSDDLIMDKIKTI